jgi:hypothetical protein
MVELRRYHTKNVWAAWQQLVEAQILPLMDEIRVSGAYSARGQEMIRQIKTIIGPWSVPRPWPLIKKGRKEATRDVLRLPAVISKNDQAATA